MNRMQKAFLYTFVHKNFNLNFFFDPGWSFFAGCFLSEPKQKINGYIISPLKPLET